MKRPAPLAVVFAALLALAMSGQAGAGEGRSALDEVFPDGLPFPFERVLEKLRAEAGPDAVRTALIPLGRSLQRYSAAPDFFGSPRIVLAVSRDRARGPDGPRLADRLYLGYVPAAAVIEAISYDEAAGGFAFQQVIGYGETEGWRTERADRSICLRCHQGEGPIFARPLWSESNANPAVAARLGGLGPVFHGVPARQSIDELDAFDSGTDRAARISVANRLWADGCSDPGCRAALFTAALRFGLNGARADWQGGENLASAAFAERAATLWPRGLSVISPDLPNRDPAAMLASTAPEEWLETTGALNPETPREHVVLWRPGTGAFDAAAREVAAMLSPGDYAWLDALLRRELAPARDLSLRCAVETASVGGATETRFACGGGESRIEGFLRPDGSGRIDRLTVAGGSVPARMPVRVSRDGAAYRIEWAAASPRLPDGSRIGAITLAGANVRVEIADDFTPLATALERHARDGGTAFGSGPVRRSVLLRLVADLLEGADG